MQSPSIFFQGAAGYPWLSGIHIAYTQTSFWDLESESKPFKDTSYKPELFFQSSNLGKGLSWLKGAYLQAGIQHESNGRGGLDSRSTNYFYLKPMVVFYSGKRGLGVSISPKIWGYWANEDRNNPDLHAYRGYFDLEIKAGWADSLVVGTHLRWAAAGPSIQVDATYPVHRQLFYNLDFYLQVQYVSALAESLLTFRERTDALRIGVSILR